MEPAWYTSLGCVFTRGALSLLIYVTEIASDIFSYHVTVT
jgi:hypothetical protein